MNTIKGMDVCLTFLKIRTPEMPGFAKYIHMQLQRVVCMGTYTHRGDQSNVLLFTLSSVQFAIYTL